MMSRGADVHHETSTANHKADEVEKTQSPSEVATDNRARVVKTANKEYWSATEKDGDAQIPLQATAPATTLQPSESMALTAKQVPIVLELISETSDFKGGRVESNMPAPTGAKVPSGSTSGQEKAKMPAVRNDSDTHVPVGIVQDDLQNPPVQKTSSGQENGPTLTDGGSQLKSPKAIGEHATKGAYDITLELPAADIDGDANSITIPNEVQNFDMNTPTQGMGVIFNVAMGQPLQPEVQNELEASQTMAKTAPKGVLDTVASQNPAVTSAQDVGKAGDGSSGEASSHSAQNGTPLLQDSTIGTLKTELVASGAQDGGASPLQAQAVAMHMASHGNATPEHVANAAEEMPRASKPQEASAPMHADTGNDVAASGINAAKLIQTMGETEMHVGMHSTEFGDISIRTTISQQQMLAQISLDHGDLSQAMSAHVALVQTKLGDDYGLHTSIEINNQSPLLSGDSGSSSQQEQRSSYGAARNKEIVLPETHDSSTGLGIAVSTDNGHGLDIRI